MLWEFRMRECHTSASEMTTPAEWEAISVWMRAVQVGINSKSNEVLLNNHTKLMKNP